MFLSFWSCLLLSPMKNLKNIWGVSKNCFYFLLTFLRFFPGPSGGSGQNDEKGDVCLVFVCWFFFVGILVFVILILLLAPTREGSQKPTKGVFLFLSSSACRRIRVRVPHGDVSAALRSAQHDRNTFLFFTFLRFFRGPSGVSGQNDEKGGQCPVLLIPNLFREGAAIPYHFVILPQQ